MKKKVNNVSTKYILMAIIIFCTVFFASCGNADVNQSDLSLDVVVEQETVTKNEEESENDIDQNSEDRVSDTDEDVFANVKVTEEKDSVSEDIVYVEMYTTSKVNIRTEASTDSEIYKTVGSRTGVMVSEVGDEWCKVWIDDSEYYIKSEFLRKKEAVVVI